MNREYTPELEKIEEYLIDFIPPVLSSAWYKKVFPGMELKSETAENLIAPGRDLFMRGGKRWRPLLSLLVCKSLGGGDSVLPLLPLVEFSHNASLIHDDLEDNSDERRGKPAVHLLYGSDTAINSGSFLYFLSLTVLENFSCDPEDVNRLWKLWAEHIRFLHLGQSMDIAWHRNRSFFPSLDDYMLMCRLKTGSLAKFAVLLGIEAARISHKKAVQKKPAGSVIEDGKDTEYNGLMTAYGEAAQKLGVGFQILDDVKNLSTGIPGKKRGDDLVEGKKSLPVLLFILNSGSKLKAGRMNWKDREAFVQRCFKAAGEGGTNVPEVEEFVEKLTGTGALEEALNRGKSLISEAIDAFSAMNEITSLLNGLLETF